MKLKYGCTIIVIVGTLSKSDGILNSCIPEKQIEFDNLSLIDQWAKLELMRRISGGILYVTPSSESAMRELLDDFIGEDGFIKETGRKIVHTKEHGDFCVNLVWNKVREDWVDD